MDYLYGVQGFGAFYAAPLLGVAHKATSKAPPSRVLLCGQPSKLRKDQRLLNVNKPMPASVIPLVEQARTREPNTR